MRRAWLSQGGLTGPLWATTGSATALLRYVARRAAVISTGPDASSGHGNNCCASLRPATAATLRGRQPSVEVGLYPHQTTSRPLPFFSLVAGSRVSLSGLRRVRK